MAMSGLVETGIDQNENVIVRVDSIMHE